MIKRSIRLKEFIPLRKKTHFPSRAYLGDNHQLSYREGYYESSNESGVMEFPGIPEMLTNIVFLGDSFVENIFVKESFRALNILQECFLNDKYNVKIHNYAVSGATGLGLFNSYINKIIPLNSNS